MAVAASLNLPQPVPPVTAGLAEGYRLTPHGCIANARALTAFELENARLRARASQGITTDDDAVTFYRRKLRETEHENVSAGSVDLGYRMPLSIALYRTHRVAEARAEWRLLLTRQVLQPAVDAGTRSALAGRFRDALIAYAMSPPGYSPQARDAGAMYNLQRGLNVAAGGDLSGARTFLNYAVECDPFFEVPHLALGVIAAVRHDLTGARHEWIADIEGADAAPPDTAGPTQAQYDAIRLLLRFG
ncbi:MAG TPA: hypothetical protein VIW69_19205 [Candidatus Elarobacter sp.]